VKAAVPVILFVIAGAACPRPTHRPRTYSTPLYGNVVHDNTGRADPASVDCTIRMFLHHMPLMHNSLPKLEITFEPDVIRYNKDDGEYTANGLFWCNSRNPRTHIMLREGACVAGTSLVHEFLHFAREELLGDCDREHVDAAWWGESQAGGLWLTIYSDVVAECCLED
jgi:hypothetical protein